jgi:type IV pilus assembly protein PilN
MTYLFINFNKEIKSLRQRYAARQRELATFKDTNAKINALKKNIAELRVKLETINELERAKTGPVKLLDDISMSVPKEKLWLTNLAEKKGILSLTGTAMDNETVADFMKRLDGKKTITSVELVKTKRKIVSSKTQQERYYEQAIADYNEIIKNNPEDDMAYMELGVLYRSQKNFPKAIQQLNFANKLNPNNADVYYYLGLCYKETNQLEAAIRNFKKYLELNPNVEKIHFELANLYSLKNRTAFAIIEFENVIRLNSNNSDAYRRLGALYEAQGMYQQSLENYQIAVKLNSNDLEAHLALNWLYNKLGMKAKAEAEKKIIQRLENQ